MESFTAMGLSNEQAIVSILFFIALSVATVWGFTRRNQRT
jgi:hypothetical protein